MCGCVGGSCPYAGCGGGAWCAHGPCQCPQPCMPCRKGVDSPAKEEDLESKEGVPLADSFADFDEDGGLDELVDLEEPGGLLPSFAPLVPCLSASNTVT
mmetsp:Transcript_60014/g.186116  ORF Transcript_60014/g.186116 Transcript_60014/m.186116 type:complete len:99 (+) Transcript_60014:414-710(+)